MRRVWIVGLFLLLLPVVSAVAGDVNSDGVVDILDLVSAVNCMNGNCNGQEDLNSDGAVDILDLVIIVNNLGNSGPSGPVCGNNACESGETCSNCPQDCNSCTPPSTSIDCNNPHPDWQLCEDFETNLNQWPNVCGLCEIRSDPTQTDNVLYIPYCVNGGNWPSTVPDPEKCSNGGDSNRFVSKNMGGQNLHHFFVGGFLYIPYRPDQSVQKKLYYFFSQPWGSNFQNWDLILTAWDSTGLGQDMSITVGSNGYSYSDVHIPINCGRPLRYDKWQFLEIELKLNTVGKSDAETRVWVDGVKVCERTGFQLRVQNYPLGEMRVGAQINSPKGPWPAIERRYWDDVVVSKSRILVSP